MKKLKYKLRAECLPDVLKLMLIIKFSAYRMENERFPDVDVEFSCDESLEDIKKALETIIDSHVMLETVALLENYTGER